MKKFNLKLIAPSGIAFEGEVDQATIPTPDGQITILSDHMPVMTLLSPGEINIQSSSKTHYLATEGGIAYVSKNFLKILADTAESADSLDQAKIEEARQKAATQMSNAADDMEFAHAEAMLEKQLAKLNFIKKRKKYK